MEVGAGRPTAAVNERHPTSAGHKVVPQARRPSDKVMAVMIELRATEHFVQPFPVAAPPFVIRDYIGEYPAKTARGQGQVVGLATAEHAGAKTRAKREPRVKRVFAKAIADAILPDAARGRRSSLGKRQCLRREALIFAARRRRIDESAGQQESRESADSPGPSAASTKVHCCPTSTMDLFIALLIHGF